MLPIKAVDVIRELRAAFTIALVTTLSVSALPFIISATQRLAERCGITGPERDEVIRTNVSVAYPLGQMGNFFVYLFIIYAASFYNIQLDSTSRWLLVPVSLISCISSPTSSINSVQFLSGWLGLPGDTTPFYVGLMALTRYGQVLVSVAGFAFLSFTVVLGYYGKLRLRLGKLAGIAGCIILVAALSAFAGRQLSAHLQIGKANSYLDFTLDPALTKLTRAEISSATSGLPDTDSIMAHIQRTGELQVGYRQHHSFLLSQFRRRISRL